MTEGVEIPPLHHHDTLIASHRGPVAPRLHRKRRRWLPVTFQLKPGAQAAEFNPTGEDRASFGKSAEFGDLRGLLGGQGDVVGRVLPVIREVVKRTQFSRMEPGAPDRDCALSAWRGSRCPRSRRAG